MGITGVLWSQQGESWGEYKPPLKLESSYYFEDIYKQISKCDILIIAEVKPCGNSEYE